MNARLLTDAEKLRIQEEEIFREGVRKELFAQEKDHALWKFANSSLGIWFLSTVVIGLGLALFKERDTIREDEQRYYRTKYEAMRHVYDFGMASKSARDYKQYTDTFISNLQFPKAVFYEFKGRTMTEILWKLGEFRPDQNRQDGEYIRKAIEEKFWEVIRPMNETITLTPEQKAEADRKIQLILNADVYPTFKDTRLWKYKSSWDFF